MVDFAFPVYTEAYVNSASQGKALVGQVDANNEGWAMAFEELISSNEVMRMVSFTDNANTSTCINVTNQTPSTNTVLSGATSGIWSFSWPLSSNQSFSWPGGSEDRNDPFYATMYGNNKHFVLGNVDNAGSVSFNWARVRKYSAVEPILSLGTEAEIVDEIWADNTGEYCQGETIELSSPFFTGATYAWNGPNGFTSSVQNPTIANATPSEAGKYLITISLPTGCSPLTDSTIVVVSPTSVGGTLSGATTICEGDNAGNVQLSGRTGGVIFWETAATLGGPWTTITNTTDSTSYTNLQAATHYRAFVKSGTCPQDTSNHITITIDTPSEGGNVMGSNWGCESDNAGSLNVINTNGVINDWIYSEDNGATWTTITNTTNTNSYTDLDTTRLYAVQVTNGVCPVDTSDVATIAIKRNPDVDFTAASQCSSVATKFINQTVLVDGATSASAWDFNDGNGSGVVSPSYTYANPGTYAVKLTTTSTFGCRDSITKNIIVNPLPNVAFTNVDVCDTSTMTFTDVSSILTGTLTNWTWNFGDAATGTSNIQNASYQYASAGVYDVQLIATSDSGCVDSVTQSVQVYHRAVIDFLTDSVCLGNTISFTNLTTTISDTISYDWSFGDGQNSTLEHPTNLYTNEGTYNVVLQSTTRGGCVDIDSVKATVFPQPHADFTFMNDCLYDSIIYTDASTISGGTYTSAWDFGDGFSSTQASDNHLYPSPNDYTVSLSILSDKGCSSDTAQLLTVFPLPVASFIHDNACDEIALAFQNTSSISSGALTYNWDFGDGLPHSSSTSPTHLFPTEGDYNVQLIATSNHNCTDTIVNPITVYPLPYPNFTFNIACNGDTTFFSNQTALTSGAMVNQQWNFGDGTSSIDLNPTRLFLNAGTYNVSLQVRTDFNCVKDTTIAVEVYDFPTANFEVDDECIGTIHEFFDLSVINNGTLSYAWNLGYDDTSTVILQNPTHVYDTSGLFPVKLVVSSNHGCADSVLKYTEVYALPLVYAGADTSVSQGLEVPLLAEALTGVQFIWSPTDGILDNAVLQPIASPFTTTTYNLEVVDEKGCRNNDDMTVTVIEDFRLFVSNIITPDGNGKNDTWYIGNVETFEQVNIRIFDRWGKQLWETKGYDNSWDGVVETDQLPDGTYYYTINFDNAAKTYNGSFTIFRNR